MTHPIRISSSLSEFLQVEDRNIFTRLEINRMLWMYIVSHRLLDPHNRKKIHPNFQLIKLFDLSPGETLNLFTFLNHITPHIRTL